jgi:hypothetical protein
VLEMASDHRDAPDGAGRMEQLLAGASVPDGRRRHPDDARAPAIRGVPREETVDGPERMVDRLAGQRAGG